jgi:hypothetical protein
MSCVRIVLGMAALLGLSACAQLPGPAQDLALTLSAPAAGTRNHAILVGRIEGYHRDTPHAPWVGGPAKLALTPANAPPFFNDLMLCPGRLTLAEVCGQHANGVLFGSSATLPWSSLNSFAMEVPAGTYSLTLIEAPPYLWGLKANQKVRLPALTINPGDVLNLGSIKAYFAQPDVGREFNRYAKRVATQVTIEADEAGARAMLTGINPALASALVTRLLPVPKQ